MSTFWLCFVPLFVAVDAIGVLPVFVSLTESMSVPDCRRVVRQSVLTASVVALAFVAFGPAVLKSLGITLPDFMIAGGALLFAISLSDLLTGAKRRHQFDPDSLGAVPIGIPLITGPAVLTTCLLLEGIHGKWMAGTAAVLNIVIAGLIFSGARRITAVLGRTGTRTVSKVASLLLAAIAVMLIRKGVVGVIAML